MQRGYSKVKHKNPGVLSKCVTELNTPGKECGLVTHAAGLGELGTSGIVTF